jgi:protein-S-isoprenylcysteine O-methyltransferase Ste14
MLAGIMVAASVLSIFLLDPGLLEERTGIKSGSKRWDIILGSIIGRLGPLAILITSGLDFRFNWSGSFPLMLAVLGLVLCILGYVLSLWAMRENKFFSSVVRIQKERGHHVISTGPYQMVRHPGYFGSVILTFSLPHTGHLFPPLSLSLSCSFGRYWKTILSSVNSKVTPSMLTASVIVLYRASGSSGYH